MKAPLARVLVVDWNRPDRQGLSRFLEQEGFLIDEATDGPGLLASLAKEMPHLIVLDLALPPDGGLALCQRIKRQGDVPIVVLTGLKDEALKVRALDLYAEDYIQKPAILAEVAVRIKRVLQRTWLSYPTSESFLKVDQFLSLDFLRREVHTQNGTVRLTPLESRLLQLLVRNAGQILPNELLRERLWGEGNSSAGNLWEYIRRIRHKIGDDAALPRYVLNEPGLGYRFTPLDSVKREGEKAEFFSASAFLA